MNMPIDASKLPSYNVIPIANRFNNISPSDIDDLLEDLDDMGYLSDKGKAFKKAFWKLFIKE